MFLSLPNTLTLMFTLCAICYILFIVHVKISNKQEAVFYYIFCTSSGLWSISKGLMSSSLTCKAASIWYAVSVLSFVVVLTVLIQYLVCKLLSQKTMIFSKSFILYIPAIIIITLGIRNVLIVDDYYLMVESIWGWARSDYGMVNDILVLTYYLLAVFLIIGLVILYIKRLTDTQKKKEVISVVNSFWLVLIMSAFFQSVVFGILFDVSFNVGPFLLLIPVSTGVYYLEKVNHTEKNNRYIGAEVIRSEMKSVLYSYISTTFLAGGVVAFVFEYFIGGNDIFDAFGFALVISINGFLLRIILNSRLKLYIKDVFVSFSMSLFVVFLMFFTLVKGSGTVWPAPMIFIVTFMLYNNTRMIVSITSSVIVSFIVIALIVPVKMVEIDLIDHFLRVFLTLLLFVFALIVNRFYVSAMRENRRQSANQMIVNEVTSSLVSVVSETFEETFVNALALISKHFQMDQAYFFSVDDVNQMMTYKYGWSRCSEVVIDSQYHQVSFKDYQWIYEQIKDDGHIFVEDTTTSDETAIIESDIVTKNGILSIYGTSIYSQDKMIGYIGMETKLNKKKLHSDDMGILKILGNVLCDALQRNQAEKQIRRMAYHDHLTGLPNRAYYFSSLEEMVKVAHRQNKGILVGLVDLDNFKRINDTHGHDLGDELLRNVALRLQENVRETDMVSRFGGDEFLLYFLGVDDEIGAQHVGKDIVSKFEKPFIIQGVALNITISLGLFLSQSGATDISQIISFADKSMYDAKQAGKNRYTLKVGF